MKSKYEKYKRKHVDEHVDDIDLREYECLSYPDWNLKINWEFMNEKEFNIAV